MNVSYEEPEIRHDRIQTDLMANERKQQNKERYADPIILSGTPEQQINSLLFAIRTYQQDLASAWKENEKLRDQIHRLKISADLTAKDRDEWMARSMSKV